MSSSRRAVLGLKKTTEDILKKKKNTLFSSFYLPAMCFVSIGNCYKGREPFSQNLRNSVEATVLIKCMKYVLQKIALKFRIKHLTESVQGPLLVAAPKLMEAIKFLVM